MFLLVFFPDRIHFKSITHRLKHKIHAFSSVEGLKEMNCVNRLAIGPENHANQKLVYFRTRHKADFANTTKQLATHVSLTCIGVSPPDRVFGLYQRLTRRYGVRNVSNKLSKQLQSVQLIYKGDSSWPKKTKATLHYVR